MKCVLITRDAALRSVGFPSGVVDAAIFVMEIDEVFVDRIACGGATLASSEKIDVFSERISGTASMMKSELERSEKEVVGSRRARALSASSWVMRDLETSFSSNLSDSHRQ